MSVLMCADHMHVSDGVLLLSGLLQRNRAILQVWLGDVQGMRESQICLIWKMEYMKDYVHTSRGMVRLQ